jgi:1H-pyrrole-2-carbonyl-[peptidyl-carrier protein] chlorinase
MEAEFDVGIIGGGPGGAVAASYLAKAGLKAVILERAIFPREHVGESFVPAINRALTEVGFNDQMDEAGVPQKFGAVWTAKASARAYQVDWEGLSMDGHADIRFEERQQAGVDRKYTWHVDRGKFDLMMLQHANKLGAAVYEGVRVKGVDFSDPELPKIKFDMGKQEIGVKVKVVLDASGRQTLLGNQLKLKRPDPVFDQYALHTWFEGYDRRALAKTDQFAGYIFIHFLPISNTWIWQIPISETVTSIGVVTQKKNFEKSKESREKFFWDCVGSRPELLEGLKASKQMRPLKEEGDYSYGMSQICGDGYALIGDAARFVDPIFSSGVSIAMTSARLATADIIKAASNGGFKKAAFDTYEATMRRGTNNWYEFISVYYRLNVLFTAFIQDPRYRIQVLKLLQGDLYDEEKPEVLNVMKRTVAQVEQNPNHPWHGFLGELTHGSFQAPLY